MLYVEEKDFARQMDVLRASIKSSDLLVCAWLYPDVELTSLAGFKVVPNQGLEPVTTYEDGTLPYRTELAPAIDSVIEAMRGYEAELHAYCDSITLYSPGSIKWAAATVGHEGMCLVRSDKTFYQLQEAGFRVSKQAPAW